MKIGLQTDLRRYLPNWKNSSSLIILRIYRELISAMINESQRTGVVQVFMWRLDVFIRRRDVLCRCRCAAVDRQWLWCWRRRRWRLPARLWRLLLLLLGTLHLSKLCSPVLEPDLRQQMIAWHCGDRKLSSRPNVTRLDRFNSLVCNANYSTTSNNMKLVHGPLMGGLLHLVQGGGPGRAAAPPSPLLAVPNATAHPSTASVPITVLLYNGPLLCGLLWPLKGSITPFCIRV